MQAESGAGIGPRAAQPSKLDAFKPIWKSGCAQECGTRECFCANWRERNYAGSYTILTDWLQPQRSATRVWPCGASKPLGQAGASGLGHLGTLEAGRARTEAARIHLHAGLQPRCSGSSVGSKLGPLLRLTKRLPQCGVRKRFCSCPASSSVPRCPSPLAPACRSVSKGRTATSASRFVAAATVRQNRVATGVVPPRSSRRSTRAFPHSCAQPLFQIRLKRIELARLRCTWPYSGTILLPAYTCESSCGPNRSAR